ncbi:thiolase family protein [Sphingobium algorifonticola]|uniref:Thiolase family protein n=2 Tax=Sphingobium algorifonticola TaxID=2008318 RepID=A0A437JDJ3_9SPHN|nr:thiolase family protein [Sphingobium algorifonticola]RVT43961.1 thiolase family protein [Sphingobium algorifonticola]
MTPRNAVIAGYARSPFHLAGKGALARVRPDDLAAQVIAGLIRNTGVDPRDVEDVILGCAFPEGEQGMNVARLVTLIADLPLSIGAMTVNRFCGSSMSAVHMAVGQIAIGAGDVYLCGGVESMSRIPLAGFNPLPNPALMKARPGAYMGMGDTAENVATQFHVDRATQEAFAVASHRKAGVARSEGRFTDEIIPVQTRNGTVDQDGTIRPETTADILAQLKPAFAANGSVTAGTSSPLTDGASAVLMTSEDYARAHGLPILGRIRSVAVAGCAPEIMGIGPVSATRKLLERAGLSIDDVDVIELNEAFASQAIACANELGLDAAKINMDGGALALGHPLGATGARIVGKAASLLQRQGARYAVATQCVGGGQGIATLIEAI